MIDDVITEEKVEDDMLVQLVDKLKEKYIVQPKGRRNNIIIYYYNYFVLYSKDRFWSFLSRISFKSLLG